MQFIITAVGPDRPGLIDQISGQLLEAGANIADSRMINLSGEFALMMLVGVEDGDAEKVTGDLQQAGQRIGLSISVTPIAAGQPESASVGKRVAFRLRVYGMDKPGIVHRITHTLHENQVNVEEMQTHLQAGSYTGTPAFRMELLMSVPGSVQVRQLRDQLGELCDSLNCDLDL